MVCYSLGTCFHVIDDCENSALVFSRCQFCVFVERGSIMIAVERQACYRGSPNSNPLWYRFEVWAFSFSPQCPSSLSCINEYLAIDSGGNVNE